MYFCRNCREGFTDPEIETYREEHNFWGAPAYETFTIYRCPYCGSEEVEETDPCIICGEAAEPGAQFCKACHINLGMDLDSLRKEYKISLEQLKEFIAEHFGW